MAEWFLDSFIAQLRENATPATYSAQELANLIDAKADENGGTDNSIPRITTSDVYMELNSKRELVTAEHKYSGKTNYSIGGGLFNLTKCNVKVEYEGKILVGYDLTQIVPEVDFEKHIIYLSRPALKIITKDVTDWTIVDEEDGWFNEISKNDISSLLKATAINEYNKAVDEGIKNEAWNGLDATVREALGVFSDYTVVWGAEPLT